MAVSTLVYLSLVTGQILRSLGQNLTNETRSSIGQDIANPGLLSTITALTVAQIVVGIVILTLATLAVILVLLFRKRILRDLRKVLKVKPPCCHHYVQDHEDTDEPQLQGYRDTPNDQQESIRLHSLEQLDHGDPDEVGFHVSTDAQDMYEPESTRKGSLYYGAGENTDEADGYLTRAIYRYNHEIEEKSDFPHVTDPDITELEGCALYANASPETALRYDKMEDIEGEIVDEIDYQNVTIVRTQLEESKEQSAGNDHTHSPSDEDDQDYVSVDMNSDSDEEDTGNAFHNSHMLGVEGAHHQTFRQDTASFKSSQSYENVDPHQHKASTMPQYKHMVQGDVHAFSSTTSRTGYQDNTEDLYMNVSSVQY